MDRRYQEFREAVQFLLEHPRSIAAQDKVRHMLEFKVCKKCWKELPIEEFGKQDASFDGLRTYCKRCRSERQC